FFGYYESEFDQIKIEENTYNFGYNKFRLDMEARPSEQILIGANLNVQQFFGKKTWDLFDFVPDGVWEKTFGDTLISEFPYPILDTLFLDNVYLRASFSKFDVTVGKQQIALGTGYAWNPTDIFNQKDLLDPTYENPGINAVRVEIPLGSRLLADLIVTPGSDWNISRRFIQLKMGLGSFDLMLISGTFQWDRTGIELDTMNIFMPIQESVIPTERQIVGGAIVGELFGLGLWAEGAWNKLKEEDDYVEFLTGFDYTFDFQTYLMVEYYHNGSGISGGEELRFNDYIYYLNGETHSLMQDYSFVYLNHPLADLLTIGVFGIVNFNDESFVINPQLEWNAFENVNVTLLISQSFGDDKTEFGVQDRAVRLRLRAYF
ncbi:MAG: hypothetical protein H8E82_06655, partial [Candidatus Marinimicrobia bacterium]|nr:hypothetical protein [Candidatus Neomarinimicrobiota bacterium]